jgi:hypothetical protein
MALLTLEHKLSHSARHREESSLGATMADKYRMGLNLSKIHAGGHRRWIVNNSGWRMADSAGDTGRAAGTGLFLAKSSWLLIGRGQISSPPDGVYVSDRKRGSTLCHHHRDLSYVPNDN